MKEKTVMPDPPLPHSGPEIRTLVANSVTCLCTPFYTLIFVAPEVAAYISKSGLLTPAVPSEQLIN